jgi:hypothetical protein
LLLAPVGQDNRNDTAMTTIHDTKSTAMKGRLIEIIVEQNEFLEHR